MLAQSLLLSYAFHSSKPSHFSHPPTTSNPPSSQPTMKPTIIPTLLFTLLACSAAALPQGSHIPPNLGEICGLCQHYCSEQTKQDYRTCFKRACAGKVRLPTQLSNDDYTLASGADLCGSAFSISISRPRDLGMRGVVLWWLEEGVRAMAVLYWDGIC
jgi:hypothetical protein